MSLPFNTDTSEQLPLAFNTNNSYDPLITSNALVPYATSNYIISTSNILQTNINTKQATLTASTSLLGNGANITNLAYANITGKPTNFQADWNSTVINKPSTFPADMTTIYTKTETNNLLNTKLTIPTASTTLIGIGSNLTFLDYLNIKNPPILNYLQLTGGSITGNITTQQLYINNPDSTASIFFNPTASIYALFSKKPPWAMYFAEDYNIATPTILPNYISNGRDAVCSGTITKTTLAGNGATGAITYISGSTVATIAFPDGSIPSQFTILALTRYNGGTRRRILQANGANWLHGHWSGTRGCTYYNDGWKSSGYTTNLDNWVCTIGKNVGATPGNMLIDGVATGIAGGGAGALKLGVNYGSYGSGESSDWCLSCVMIWSEGLTDAEMVDLNTIINNYKTSGTPIKTLLDTINDDECVIESRIYGGTEKTELLLFKGNDATGTNGADRIRLRAGNIAFDTYSSVTTNRNLENIVMLINENGNVGIGTTTNLTNKLNVNGITSSTSFIGNGAALTNLAYANIEGKPTNFQTDWNSTVINKPSTFEPTMTYIYTKSETDTLLNTKQPNLTFTSPLTNTANNVSINLGQYSTTGNDGNYLLKTGGTITGTLNVNGIANIHNGNTFSVTNNYMQSGSLTIGGINANYGTGGNQWTTNTAGLMMECLDYTEIAVHDAGQRVASLMYYDGPANIIYIGRNKGWVITNTNIVGSATAASFIGVGSSLTSLDWNNITLNKPTTFAPIMTDIYTKSNIDTLLNAKQPTLTAATSLLGNGSAITSIAYANITGTPTMANYVLKAGDTMTGALTVSSGINISGATNAAQSLYFRSTDYNLGIAGGVGQYSSTALQNDMILRTLTNTNLILQSGSGGYGLKINTANNISCSGTLTATSFIGIGSSLTTLDWNNITLNKPSTFPATMTDIYTKSETDTLLNTKQPTLTAATNLLGIGSAITSIAYANITGTPTLSFLPLTGGTITGDTTINGIVKFKNDNWHQSIDNIYRFFYATNGTTFICGGGSSTESGLVVYSSAASGGYYSNFTILNNGNTTIRGTLNINGDMLKFPDALNQYKINLWGTNSYGFGIAAGTLMYSSQSYHKFYNSANNVNTFTIDSVGNATVAGELTAGQSYLGGLRINGADGNTFYNYNRDLGLLVDITKTIKLSLWGTGGGDIITASQNGVTINRILSLNNAYMNINGDLNLYASGIYSGSLYCAGYITATFNSTTNSGTDYIGVTNADNNNTPYARRLFIMFASFTAHHRCFTEDLLYDNNNPQKFKDDYVGRIVVSTGKIATDTKDNYNNPDEEWNIKYDKDGIMIEDAIPQIELSRKRKDKRVFGVLGDPKRNNSRPERLVINSIGEGAIWVCSSNGNIENGDYIQSSDYLGYGEKQDEIFLCNYTVAKTTMCCNFELDSPLYECREIEDGLRIAFIAVSYHCG